MFTRAMRAIMLASGTTPTLIERRDMSAASRARRVSPTRLAPRIVAHGWYVVFQLAEVAVPE